MSLLITSQPLDGAYLSAGNDNFYAASGSTYGAPTVTGYKLIADIYVNGLLQVTLKSYPDPKFGVAVFNTKNILNSFIGFDFFDITPPTPMIIKNCPNSSVRVQIQFGEEYVSGSTEVYNPGVLTSNTGIYINGAFLFVNAAQGKQLAPYYQAQTNVLANQLLLSEQGNRSSNGNAGIVNNLYNGSWSVVYFASNIFASIVAGQPLNTSITSGISSYSASNFTGLQAIFTQSSGIVLSGATDVMAAVVSIAGIGLMNSGNTQAGFGSFPVIKATTNSIDVFIGVPFRPHAIDFAKYVLIQDCGRTANTAYTVSWLNKVGGMDSFYFNKKNETTVNKTTQRQKRLYGSVQSNGTFNTNMYSGANRDVFTVLQDSITMSTDWVLDTDVTMMKSLFSSPRVYITDTNGVTTSVTLKDDSYRIVKKVNQKLYSLQITVEPAYNNYRQQF